MQMCNTTMEGEFSALNGQAGVSATDDIPLLAPRSPLHAPFASAHAHTQGGIARLGFFYVLNVLTLRDKMPG